MWNKTELTQIIGLQYPIIQAPMAGGATTPALVASISELNGLGSLGAGYLSPDVIRDKIKAIRAITQKPLAVNLFVPNEHKASSQAIRLACDAINQCARQLGADIKGIDGTYAPPFEEQIHVLLNEKIPVFSFTFGIPGIDIIKEFKSNNTIVIGTATTLEEAQALEEYMVDAIILQGSEAGGHRGGFLEADENSLYPLKDLLRQVKKSIHIPLIASGGIMDGRAIVEHLELGASAVQLGTAFLCCPETGIPEAYKKLILQQDSDKTVLTRSFSGKLARGIENQYIRCMSHKEETILDYPIQNKLTQVMRTKAKEESNTEFMSLWAGQSAPLSRQLDLSLIHI